MLSVRDAMSLLNSTLEVSNKVRSIAVGLDTGGIAITNLSSLLVESAKEFDECITNHIELSPDPEAREWVPFPETDEQYNQYVMYCGSLCVYVPGLEAEPIRVIK